MSAPGGAIGVICVLGVGYLSDKWRDRTSVMLIAILPTILGAGLMIGLDPNGVPKNKAGLLAASFLTGTFGAAFMLLLAWNASYVHLLSPCSHLTIIVTSRATQKRSQSMP